MVLKCSQCGSESLQLPAINCYKNPGCSQHENSSVFISLMRLAMTAVCGACICIMFLIFFVPATAGINRDAKSVAHYDPEKILRYYPVPTRSTNPKILTHPTKPPKQEKPPKPYPMINCGPDAAKDSICSRYEVNGEVIHELCCKKKEDNCCPDRKHCCPKKWKCKITMKRPFKTVCVK